MSGATSRAGQHARARVAAIARQDEGCGVEQLRNAPAAVVAQAVIAGALQGRAGLSRLDEHQRQAHDEARQIAAVAVHVARHPHLRGMKEIVSRPVRTSRSRAGFRSPGRRVHPAGSPSRRPSAAGTGHDRRSRRTRQCVPVHSASSRTFRAAQGQDLHSAGRDRVRTMTAGPAGPRGLPSAEVKTSCSPGLSTSARSCAWHRVDPRVMLRS